MNLREIVLFYEESDFLEFILTTILNSELLFLFALDILNLLKSGYTGDYDYDDFWLMWSFAILFNSPFWSKIVNLFGTLSNVVKYSMTRIRCGIASTVFYRKRSYSCCLIYILDVYYQKQRGVR